MGDPHAPGGASRVANVILGFLGEVPGSTARPSGHPAEAARAIAVTSAAKAAAAAGTLALPPGPLGWLTILPEMLAVWRIQANMVADIAAYYGKSGTLTQEQMLYCLFKHTASQAVRDLVVRMGERMLVKQASLKALQAVAQRIGMKVTQRGLSHGASRWLPVVGAMGVAAYAYYDTVQVAKAAIELFERDIVLQPPVDADTGAAA
ncbi:hypothetical protein [Ideonella sp.]|uniref:hypothetical protein n=1 Tax=Ideonella sp. TaxID=1929293 RepID=UPI0035B3CC16